MAECKTEVPKSLQDEFEKISVEMDSRNLWEYENSVKTILTDLGITDFSKKMNLRKLHQYIHQQPQQH